MRQRPLSSRGLKDSGVDASQNGRNGGMTVNSISENVWPISTDRLGENDDDLGLVQTCNRKQIRKTAKMEKSHFSAPEEI